MWYWTLSQFHSKDSKYIGHQVYQLSLRMDHGTGRKGSGHSNIKYRELEEENEHLKKMIESNEKEFGDMYNKIHSENVQLKVKILTLQMENADFIGIQSKLESVLICDECDKRFENKEDFINHILLRHQVKSFTCNLCGECSKSKAGMRIHMTEVHDEIYLRCTVCNQSYKTKRDLKIHTKKKHMQSAEKDKFLKYQNELISNISKQKSKLYESIISLKRKEDTEKSRCKCINKFCTINHSKFNWSHAKSDELYGHFRSITTEKEKLENKIYQSTQNDNIHEICYCKKCDVDFDDPKLQRSIMK